jgi:hypothetical protein
MPQMSKPLEAALAAVAKLPLDQQNLIAMEIADLASALAAPSALLSAQERAELELELAAARRGELASETEVSAVFAKLGL